MSTLVKSQDKEFLDLLASSYKSTNSLSRLSDINKRSLKELVSYLTKLKEDKLLDNKQFAELISLACANYIENEVESKISKSINDKFIFFLDRI